MLRPATPLSVLLFVAFALLLLSTLSTPVITAIPLGAVNDVEFGVFGFCNRGACSEISVGYSIDEANGASFDLPDSVRSPLAAILIVHPVAALITLVMFIMAVAAHFHAPGHSSRYLLVHFIFLVIDFLVCLLAFLVDVLIFIPHLGWGSYVVLAATILVLVSGVVSCAMRRSINGRKSRRKAIAQNAEMSGENFYNREAHTKTTVIATSEPSIPTVSGANPSAADSLPQFASFEQSRKSDNDNDERIPLTQRSPVNRSPPNPATIDMADPGSVPAFKPPSRSGSQDRFGSPVNGGPDAYGMARGPGSAYDRQNSRGRGNMGPPGGYRGGRGGYGRGGYDNYGAPMRGRGGYGPPGRGGYGPRGGRGGYGPPPRGYGPGPGGMRGGRPPPPGPNMPGSFDRRPPGDAYVAYNQPQGSDPSLDYGSNQTTNYSLPSAGGSGNVYEPYNPNRASLPRAESPPPLPGNNSDPAVSGDAIEMDASPSSAPRGFGQFGPIRDSDVDVAGMVGLQQGKAPMGRHDTYMSEESKYSSDEQYNPPRAAWNQGSGRSSPRVPSPLNVQTRSGSAGGERNSPAPALAPPNNNTGYYEDVDPRFATSAPPHNHQQSPPPQINVPPPIEPIYEDVHAGNSGARSPAESERSNFTSISQRGINPRWNGGNPPPPMPQHQGLARRPVPQQRQDVLLDMPDFQIPGGSNNSQRGGGPGMIPGSAYPTGRL